MASTVSARAETRKANSSVDGCRAPQSATSPDKSVARSCLVAELEQSGIPRKLLAELVLGRDDEAQFSKMVGGSRPFDIGELEKLPRPQLIGYLCRFCAAIGLTAPREQDLGEIADELLKHIEQLSQLAKLARVRRPRPAKAVLPADPEPDEEA